MFIIICYTYWKEFEQNYACFTQTVDVMELLWQATLIYLCSSQTVKKALGEPRMIAKTA